MYMLTEDVRGRIYASLPALQVVLVSFGVISEQHAALWVSMITALLGLGLAAINTDTWRKYAYGLIAPAQALLVYYGIMSDHQASAIAGLVISVLGLGVAAAKTPHHER